MANLQSSLRLIAVALALSCVPTFAGGAVRTYNAAVFGDIFPLTNPRTAGVSCVKFMGQWDAAFVRKIGKFELARERLKDRKAMHKRAKRSKRAALASEITNLTRLTKICTTQGRARGSAIVVTPTPSSIPVSTETPIPTATSTPLPTQTSIPTATSTPLPTQTSTPTVTPTAIPPPPVAISEKFIGVGLAPIPVTLRGEPGIKGATLKCEFLNPPKELVIAQISNCGFTITPKVHSSETRNLSFILKRSDGVVSAPATLTLTWNQSGPFVGDPLALVHYKETLTEAEAGYVSRWLNLGAELSKIRELATTSGGLDATIDYLLASKSCPQIEAEATELASVTKYPASWHSTAGKFAGLFHRTSANEWSSPATAKYYWLYHMRYGCEPLRERLALLIHNTFVANTQRLHGAFNLDSSITEYLKFVRSSEETRLIAPFGKIVNGSYSNPAIINYLNAASIPDRLPNQNFARELMELMVLGARDPIKNSKNFDEESDVVEMAWTLRGTMANWYADDEDRTPGICDPNAQITDPNDPTRTVNRYSPALQELCRANDGKKPFPKTIIEFKDEAWRPFGENAERGKNLFAGKPWQSGTLLKAKGIDSSQVKENGLDYSQDTLTPHLLYKHPASARFLAARLIASFSFISPTEEMVAEVAKDLVDNQYQFEPVLKKLFTSSSMFSTESRSDCIASPVETFVSFLRSLDLPLLRQDYDDDGFGTLVGYPFHLNWGNVFNNSGQGLFNPATVFGWSECGKITANRIHDGTTWLNLQWWLGRVNGIVAVLNMQRRQGYDWKKLLIGLPSRPTPTQVVDSLVNRLSIEITEQERALLVKYLTQVSLGTVVTETSELPDATKQREVQWAALTDAEFTALWQLKGPGLVELIFGMKRNHVK